MCRKTTQPLKAEGPLTSSPPGSLLDAFGLYPNGCAESFPLGLESTSLLPPL